MKCLYLVLGVLLGVITMEYWIGSIEQPQQPIIISQGILRNCKVVVLGEPFKIANIRFELPDYSSAIELFSLKFKGSISNCVMVSNHSVFIETR